MGDISADMFDAIDSSLNSNIHVVSVHEKVPYPTVNTCNDTEQSTNVTLPNVTNHHIYVYSKSKLSSCYKMHLLN